MMDEEISVIDGDEGKLLSKLVQFVWSGGIGELSEFCPFLGFLRALPLGGLKYQYSICFFSCPVYSTLLPTAQVTQQPGHLFWPPGSALTARLRRLVTAYQRSYKREQMKIEAAERGDRRRRRCEAAFKLKEIARREKQQR